MNEQTHIFRQCENIVNQEQQILERFSFMFLKPLVEDLEDFKRIY